jgi:3-methyladenine DNA glycosylase Mpg
VKIEAGQDPGAVEISTRVGVHGGAGLLRRFSVAGHRSVSRPRPRPEAARPWIR